MHTCLCCCHNAHVLRDMLASYKSKINPKAATCLTASSNHNSLFCRSQLVQAKEESMEMGGYFICNGIERIIRMLIQQRRHYIMALRRSAYHKRGNNYTDAATLIRCVFTIPSSQIMFAKYERSARSHTHHGRVALFACQTPFRHTYLLPCAVFVLHEKLVCLHPGV